MSDLLHKLQIEHPCFENSNTRLASDYQKEPVTAKGQEELVGGSGLRGSNACGGRAYISNQAKN